ncbi:MAG: UDP-N-acetylmuramoyl-L-alanine--D-glutamate ligase [Candidatus Omnitrophica bacterium]|nr:UDP-N-acetylmuramoyl-L-alanine--D-glutamate ligase [Candidatus Omnitrophota bacterium]
MKQIQLEGKKVCVLGAGETGVQSALFLKSRGASVFLSELKQSRDMQEAKKQLEGAGIACEFGEHDWEEIRHYELVIISPGIPPSVPIYQKIARAGIPMWSEIELAYRASESPIIAVTGSNGKTTVTTLIRDVLRAGGRSAESCGNIGNSFVREVEKLGPETIAVVEVSSFQLVHIDQFTPHIAVLLNLSPNHLDWHGSFDRYAEMKFRIFKNQTKANYALINQSDSESAQRSKELNAQVVYFDGQDLENPNYGAIYKVAELYGIDSNIVRSVLENFSGLEHRYEDVGNVLDVRYINDSKSTTIASLSWALERVPAQAVLVAGGRHKGGNFKTLRDLVKRKVKFLILIGEAKKEIEAAFGDLVSIYSADTLEEALRAARSVSRSGDTVLFSPACASFDMFRDYQDRGEQFKRILSTWRDTLVPTSSQ